MDLDYDEDGAEVAPMMFVPEVAETPVDSAVDFGEVNFVPHRISTPYGVLGNRTATPLRTPSWTSIMTKTT